MPKSKSNFFGRSRFFSATDKSIARLHRNHKDLSTKISQSQKEKGSSSKNKYRQTKKDSGDKRPGEAY